MKTTEEQKLSPNLIEDSLISFLKSAISVEATSYGFVFTSNVCMPDGTQIPIEITQVSKNDYKLSDRGLIISSLLTNEEIIDIPKTISLWDNSDENDYCYMSGFGNYENFSTHYTIIDYMIKFCKNCDVKLENKELTKLIKSPLQGKDIHVFSEALKEIANLYLLKET